MAGFGMTMLSPFGGVTFPPPRGLPAVAVLPASAGAPCGRSPCPPPRGLPAVAVLARLRGGSLRSLSLPASAGAPCGRSPSRLRGGSLRSQSFPPPRIRWARAAGGVSASADRPLLPRSGRPVVTQAGRAAAAGPDDRDGGQQFGARRQRPVRD